MRSARPSMPVRSSFPCSKARRANSPGSASRQPSILPIASSVATTTARPPWICSSAMSSPVSLLGAANQSARPWSMTSPVCGWRMRRKAANRGLARGAAILSSTLPAAGPQMRTTATPARPCPLERAKIVTWSAIGTSRVSACLPVIALVSGLWSPTGCARRLQSMSENRLAHETSPYLLQHKDNPVHWWAWGPEALAEAKRTGKPILLSVGYAACHWCHVMAHESFEDAAVATLMNELYVNIKVDREERPDIDAIYMRALHALGEQGGWPLTMFLDSDARPFWGGTYFPPTPRYGRPGFTQVLREVSRVFAEERDKVTHNAGMLINALNAREAGEATPVIEDRALADLTGRMVSAVDPVQ